MRSVDPQLNQRSDSLDGSPPPGEVSNASADKQRQAVSNETPVHEGERVTDPASLLSSESADSENRVRRRRVKLPVILFLLTCMSTFWVGLTFWSPLLLLPECFQRTDNSIAVTLMPLRRAVVAHWDQGLIYMVCVMAILLAHELGHFFATLYYRVPASLPIFLPFPFNPIGTFGAVIGMQGNCADRKQIFDIGIAGPIAGLVIAVPVMVIGVCRLDLTVHQGGEFALQCPLAVQWLMSAIRPTGYESQGYVWISQLNPYFAAGWVGLLITGFNMMPISQLDGGHVTYTLFGNIAHWIARGTMVVAIAFMVYNMSPVLVLMVVLILIVGTDHPPTRDDRVQLGWPRKLLGFTSLAIPILCFPPFIMKW